MAAPRVLVIGSVLAQARGGVWRHNAELLPRAARSLTERGGSLSILEGRETCAFPLPPEVERLASPIVASPPLRRASLEGRWVRRTLAEAAQRGTPFDLVHTAHHPVPRGLDVPYTVLLHDLRALQARHSPFSRRLVARELIGRAGRAAARLMTVSEAMRDELATTFDLNTDTIDVVPNAADHFTVLERATTPGAPMVSIGHLEPRKNQALLLRAMALDPSLPDLRLAGLAKGAMESELRELAQRLGIAARVHFVGSFEDHELPTLYARASCIVLPSLLEGFGIVAIEAQRAGAPLAISRIRAHVEVAAAGTPAFDPDDPAECAEAIHAALALEEDALASASRGTERYSWDASATALVDAWTRAADR